GIVRLKMAGTAVAPHDHERLSVGGTATLCPQLKQVRQAQASTPGQPTPQKLAPSQWARTGNCGPVLRHCMASLSRYHAKTVLSQWTRGICPLGKSDCK